MNCPSGSANINWPLRHCVDFSGVSNKIFIPDELIAFQDFRYNEKKRRCSFVTANNSWCRKEFYTEVFSIDKYQIDKWNDIFIKANQNIKYDMPNSPGGVKFYDFVNRDSEDKNAFTSYQQSKEILTKLPDSIPAILWIAGITTAIYLLNKPKK